VVKIRGFHYRVTEMRRCGEGETGGTGETGETPSSHSSAILRFKFATFGKAFGRAVAGMVRGQRPRLQTNRIYPCRFVSIRDCPLAERFRKPAGAGVPA